MRPLTSRDPTALHPGEPIDGDLDMGTNNIINVGTVDGRDVAQDGAKLDTVSSGADVSPETLADLSDVSSAAPANGQAMVWNAGTGEWEPQDQAGGEGGGTDDQVAAEVPFTPAGSIEATNTQSAVEEVAADAAAALTTGLAGKANAADLTSHTGDLANPHGVTATQAGAAPAVHAHAHSSLTGVGTDDHHAQQHGLGSADHTAATLAQLNALVSDATLDDASAARTPTAHTHTVDDLDAQASTSGQVPTSDGEGGVTWQDQVGGGTIASITHDGAGDDPVLGDTVTVTLAAGWSASGFQWTRDTVNIGGATSADYTLTSSDDEVDLSVKLSGLVYTPVAIATGAATPVAPSGFTAGQWEAASAGDGTSLDVTVITLPDDGGSVITDIQYRVDGGTATSFDPALATTGLRQIPGLTQDLEVAVELRAVNAVGPGPWSDVKNRTPSATTWRDDVSGIQDDWPAINTTDDTLVSGDLDIWRGRFSAWEYQAPSALQRPTDTPERWDFDRSNSQLLESTDAGLLALVSGTNSWTIATRYTIGSMAANQVVWSFGDAQENSIYFQILTNGQMRLIREANDVLDVRAFSTAFGVGDTITLVGRYDGSQLSLAMNGGAVSSISSTESMPSLSISRIGSAFGATQIFDGVIHECLISNAALSDADMTDIHTNLAADYPD